MTRNLRLTPVLTHELAA